MRFKQHLDEVFNSNMKWHKVGQDGSETYYVSLVEEKLIVVYIDEYYSNLIFDRGKQLTVNGKTRFSRRNKFNILRIDFDVYDGYKGHIENMNIGNIGQMINKKLLKGEITGGGMAFKIFGSIANLVKPKINQETVILIPAPIDQPSKVRVYGSMAKKFGNKSKRDVIKLKESGEIRYYLYPKSLEINIKDEYK